MEVRIIDYGFLIRAIQLGSLDPRDDFPKQRGAPFEELEEVPFDLNEHGKFFKIGKLLGEPLQTQLIEFIRVHQGDFAWTHHDILGIGLGVIVYKLNINKGAKLVKQK